MIITPINIKDTLTVLKNMPNLKKKPDPTSTEPGATYL